VITTYILSYRGWSDLIWFMDSRKRLYLLFWFSHTTQNLWLFKNKTFHIFMSIPSQDLDFQCHILLSVIWLLFFMIGWNLNDYNINQVTEHRYDLLFLHSQNENQLVVLQIDIHNSWSFISSIFKIGPGSVL
jgi:hypothetical protein